MTCPSCGNTLTPDVRFCPRCGASATAQTQAQTQPQPPHSWAPLPANMAYSRVARHLQIAGILWLVYAFERTIGGLIGMFFLHGIFGSHFHNGFGNAWTPWGSFGMAAIWPIMIGSLAVGLVLALLTAYALLTRQPWGRVIAIVASILALIHPIFGTAIGIYTLWVFAPYTSGIEYTAIAGPSLR